MTIKMEGAVLGEDQVMQWLEGLPDAIVGPVKEEIFNGANLIRNDVIRSMKGIKHGLTYRMGAPVTRGRGKSKRVVGWKFHRASAPGEAPAVLSSNLITNEHVVIVNNGLTAKIGVTDLNNAPYARRLEYGGIDSRGVYIAPRPSLGPAFVKNRGKIVVRIGKAVATAIAEHQRRGST